jgi:hypothetical protein
MKKAARGGLGDKSTLVIPGLDPGIPRWPGHDEALEQSVR